MTPVFPNIAPWKVRVFFYGIILLGLFAVVAYFTSMPGRSAEAAEPGDSEVANALRREVEALVAFGPRNFDHPVAYSEAGHYVEGRLSEVSGRVVHAEKVAGERGASWNYFVEWGRSKGGSLVLVGAHYDTALDTPGGNDNGTGVAVLLYLARRFRMNPPDGRSLRLVLFANEEPPHFWTEEMGSLVHARSCKKRAEEVTAMISLETMGHFTSAPKSQNYPFPFGLFYPSRGNFIAFVGNVSSRALVADSVRAFRRSVRFPSEGGAFPSGFPGVGWSDHWAFWQEGYPALMVTDTAPFRDEHYHDPSDVGHQVDFGKLSVVAQGIEAVVRELTRGDAQ